MRDQAVENWLKTSGASFIYEQEIALGKFDRESSHKNQARLGVNGIIPELAEQYALAMMDGAEFPAVVAWPGSKGLVMISGNHRLEAGFLSERPSLDAYIVDPNDRQLVDLLTRSANLIMGKRPSKDETVQLAVAHLKKWGLTQVEVEHQFQLKPGAISRAKRSEVITKWLGDLGVPARGMSEIVKHRLYAVKNAPVRESVARLIGAKDLKSNHVNELVDQIQQKDDQAAQLEVVKQYSERPEFGRRDALRGKGLQEQRPQRKRLLGYLNTLESYLDRYHTRTECQLDSDDDVRQVERMGNKICSRLRSIAYTS